MADCRRMSIRRRELLRGLGGLAAYAWLPWSSGCAEEDQPNDQRSRDQPAFLHGVASGDPLSDAVILWTRVTPVDDQPVRVRWELAEDAERLDLDAVIHLGDYIYESGSGEYGELRDYEPAHEIISLADYRQRYAQYRRDADLRAMHQQFPMIAVWDDHEVANNTWLEGAQNHNPELGEGPFAARKAAALQAYREWMPIRDSEDGRCFRQLRYGELVDLILLDTRNWGREEQVTTTDAPELHDPQRSLLGPDQWQWFEAAMQHSTARWRLIGQQVMVGPYPVYWSSDDWTGYPAARERLLALLEQHAAKDSVVLTGDVHSSFAIDLMPDAERVVGVEFVAPGITSPGWDRTIAESMLPGLLALPHVKYVDLWQRGYILLDVTAERVQAAWYLYEVVEDPEHATEHFAAACATYAGEHRIRLEAEPSLEHAPAPEPAPVESRS
jgi:alkaline phosphatase D